MTIPLMEKITREKGLILWIPENPDREKIKKALESELEFVTLSLVNPDKNEIMKIILNAIELFEIFNAYPNRIIRFWICHYPECDGDFHMSWENPSRPIKSFMYRYNP